MATKKAHKPAHKPAHKTTSKPAKKASKPAHKATHKPSFHMTIHMKDGSKREYKSHSTSALTLAAKKMYSLEHFSYAEIKDGNGNLVEILRAPLTPPATAKKKAKK